jgi:hypothetical protein
MSIGLGLCHICKTTLTEENCPISVVKSGKCGYCRPCNKERLSKYYQENKSSIYKKQGEYRKKNIDRAREYAREYQKARYQATPREERDKKRKSRTGELWRFRTKSYKYKISPEELKAKLEAQNSLCTICGLLLSWDAVLKSERPHIDHNHTTGKNRDLLCVKCNSLLGYAREKEEILASAIRYLQKHEGDSSIKIETR